MGNASTKGDTGPQGLKGDTGPQGLKGDKGDSFDINTYCPADVDYCTVPSGKKIKLQSGLIFGDTGSVLDNYETYIHTTTFKNSLLTTGNIDYKITRVGSTVTMQQLTDTSTNIPNGTGQFISNVAIPERFRPTHSMNFIIPIKKGDTTWYPTGFCLVDTNGKIWITDSFGSFPSSGNIGWSTFSIAWTL